MTEFLFLLQKNGNFFYFAEKWNFFFFADRLSKFAKFKFLFFVEFQADFQAPYESRFWKFKMEFGALAIYYYLPIEIASDFNKI